MKEDNLKKEQAKDNIVLSDVSGQLSFCLHLSSLKDGDTFKFKNGQEALYVIHNGHWQRHETEENTEYVVIKKNPTSVKCRPIYGNIEYIFKFKGVFADYRNGEDCLIAKT